MPENAIPRPSRKVATAIAGGPTVFESRTMAPPKPPVVAPRSIPGSSFPEPKRGHKGKNTAIGIGTTALLGVGGCVVADQLDKTQPGNNDRPATTLVVDEPVTTLGEPSSTVITVPNTETPTTVAERVFASPEQQAQIEGDEGVEANMRAWFIITPEEIARYKETTHFTPDPDGFSTVSLYSDISAYGLLAVNLGTYPFRGGDGTSTAALFGFADEEGNVWAQLLTVNIKDSEYLSKFPTHDSFGGSNFMNPTSSGSFATTNEHLDAELIARTVNGKDGTITALNETVGQPVAIEYYSGAEYIQQQDGYPIVPNVFMEDVTKQINEFATRKAALRDFSVDELASIGVFKEPGQIPQALLSGFPTVSELMAGLPLAASFTFFNQIPRVI